MHIAEQLIHGLQVVDIYADGLRSHVGMIYASWYVLSVLAPMCFVYFVMVFANGGLYTNVTR